MKRFMSRKRYLILSLVIVIILILYIVERIFPLRISSIVELLQSFGSLSPLIYILIMALAIVISPIPSLPLVIASGIVYGNFEGFLYSIIGAQIGAMIAFFISRYFARDYVIKKFSKQIKFMERYSDNTLMIIIFILRLFPFVQFDVISYGAGITKIRWYKFAIATFFGMMPPTYLFVSTGSFLVSNTLIGILLFVIITLLILFLPKIFNKFYKL